MLQYRDTLKSYSSQTQTEIFQTVDAFTQTLNEMSKKAHMLDVAVQTLDTHFEDTHPVTSLGVTLEVQEEGEEESESSKNIQELLEAAMMSREDNEYPCKICQKKFSSLYDVKLHLIESHQEHNPFVKHESLLPNNLRQTKKKKIKKRSKFTSKKKPWCNYCWIKFKNTREYQLHKKALHTNLASRTPPIIVPTENDDASHESKTVNLHDKGEEGEEIVDRPMRNVEATCSKSPIIRYQRVESSDRGLKRKRISISSQEWSSPVKREACDVEERPMKSIKLIINKNSNGYSTTTDLHDKAVTEKSSKYVPSPADVLKQMNKEDPEVCYPFKANPSVDNLTISRNRPIRQRNDGDSKKKELLAQSPLPIKELRVILNERVEKEKHIDPSGVYICTELDKLGLSMEEFHEEMDKVVPSCQDEQVLENHSQDKLPWYEVKTHTCSLCSSVFSMGNISYHLHDEHTTSLQSYRVKFPAADLKVPSWTCKVCLTDMNWTGPSIRSHLKNSHQLNLETYQEFISSRNKGRPALSVPWYEYKVIKCKICDSIMSSSNLEDHLRVRHSCPLKDYLQKFPEDLDLTSPLFDCKVCGEKVNWNRRSIQQHLTSHDLTLPAYHDTFVSEQTRQENKAPVCSLCNQTVSDFHGHITVYHNLDRDDYLKIFPGEDEKFPDRKEEAVVIKPIKQEAAVVETEKPVSSNKDPPKDVEKQKPWYESRVTSCLHCSKQFWHGQFIRHIRSEHSQSLKDYKVTFPSASLEVDQYQCLICGACLTHYSSPISGHLTSRHGITLTEYYHRFQDQINTSVSSSLSSSLPSSLPAPPSIDEVKFTCKICQAETDCDYHSIKRHLLQHSLSWAQYQTSPVPETDSLSPPDRDLKPDISISIRKPPSNTVSAPSLPNPPVLKRRPSPSPALSASSKLERYIMLDPFYNKCTWTCLICFKVFSSGFWRHVNETHFLKKEEYLQDYGRQGFTIVNYDCLLCGKKVPWTGVNIKNHLRDHHNISLTEYETKHSKHAKVPDHLKIPSLIKNETKPSCIHNKNEKWFNGSEYQCQLCSRTLFSMAGLTSHLKEAHSRQKYDYLEEFGNRGINIRHYQCKMCDNYFPWTGVSISKHLRLAHQLSLSQYSSLHENNKSCNTKVSFVDQKEEAQKTEVGSWDNSKWYNKCSWTCMICGRMEKTNSSVFFKHVAQEHKLSVEEYKEEFGTKGVLYTDHKCKICGKNVPQNGLTLCKHLKHSHKLSLKEYEEKYLVNQAEVQSSKPYSPSDVTWYNKSYWACNICGTKNRSLGSSKKHVQTVHHITYDEYITAYGNNGIHQVDFTCVLCNSVMSCNGVTVANHLINTHKLTLSMYEARHLNRELLAEDTSEEAEENLVSTVGVENIKKEVEEEIPNPSVYKNESFTPVTREDRPWYQQCLYVCQLCGASYFSSSALNNHCKRRHNIGRENYIEKFGDTGKFLEYYSCKICNKSFKCEGKALAAHTSSVHKMSLESYSSLYEPDKNSEVNPSLDSEYYQIELNNDEDDESELDHFDDNEDDEPFKIVSVESLIMETKEDDEFNITPEVEIEEDFPELPYKESTEALVSSRRDSDVAKSPNGIEDYEEEHLIENRKDAEGVISEDRDNLDEEKGQEKEMDAKDQNVEAVSMERVSHNENQVQEEGAVGKDRNKQQEEGVVSNDREGLNGIRGKDEEEANSTTVGHNKNAEEEEEDVTSKDRSGYKEKVEDEYEEKDTGYIEVKENPDMKRFCNVRDIFDSDSE